MEDYFDWEYYVNTNQDLLEAGIDNHQIAWQHWINHGRNEGRNCLEIPEYFNWKYYILPKFYKCLVTHLKNI